MRKCTSCKKDKPLSEFRRNKNLKDGYQYYCKSCASGRIKTDYDEKYAEKVRERTYSRFKLHRAFLNKVKSIGCRLCSENEPVCLDFHHRDPSKKEFVISERRNTSMERLINEIEKCEVLCKNCHAKVHKGILSLESNSNMG